jgi:hypothetical protein
MNKKFWVKRAHFTQVQVLGINCSLAKVIVIQVLSNDKKHVKCLLILELTFISIHQVYAVMRTARKIGAVSRYV